jgi:hypothetical protein
MSRPDHGVVGDDRGLLMVSAPAFARHLQSGRLDEPGHLNPAGTLLLSTVNAITWPPSQEPLGGLLKGGGASGPTGKQPPRPRDGLGEGLFTAWGSRPRRSRWVSSDHFAHGRDHYILQRIFYLPGEPLNK